MIDKLIDFIKKYPTVSYTLGIYIVLFMLTVTNIDKVVNWSMFIRFLMSTGVFLGYILFLFPKQLVETLRPNDWLTGLRWLILGLIILIAVTLIPPMVTQYYMSIGESYDVLRNFSSIIGGINTIGVYTLLVLVFTYRRRD